MNDRFTYSRLDISPEVMGIMCKASALVKKLNSLTLSEQEEKAQILHDLFGSIGKGAFVGDNFHCDFGVNIHVGDNFHADYNCTMLDIGGIKIGNNCLIGPDVGIYTAGHALAPENRTASGYAECVEIGNDVWIGGHSTILPGVRIGNGAVIAAGSVVTRNVAPKTLVAGNPAVFKKNIE